MLDKYVLAQFFGIAIIAWSMFEAWSGQHHGKFGKIHVMESPIFYMLLTGLQLAVGISLVLDHAWMNSLSADTRSYYFLLLAVGSCAFMYLLSSSVQRLKSFDG